MIADHPNPTAHQQVLLQVVGCAPCFSTVGLYTATGMLQLPLSSITEEFKVGKARLHLMLRDSPDDVIRQVQPEVRTGTNWSAAKAVQEAEASLQIKEVIGATQTGRAGFPARTAGAVETWSSQNSRWSRKRREWPLLLAKPSSAHGWPGRKLRPGNCHGLPWWLWNLSPCPSFFAPPTTSFPPLLTISSGASQEMTPAWCASLQEGPCGVFCHPVGVHSRCIHGAITECSSYRLRSLKPSVGWPTSSPPKTQNHASVSSKKERPHLDKSANHKGKSSSQLQGTGRWLLT